MNILAEMSLDFAVQIIRLCNSIKGHYALVNQIERSATSIGANIREANYAHSKNDFIARLQISLKECYETEYWLEILMRAEIITEQNGKPLLHTAGSMRRMLIASINTAKQNRDRNNLHP
ncbi:MAG: four helix bundle protein [Oscillospiraceae bacterium]|nr:four helix bundle protein [Oscillospiraceae bacterium]